MNKEKVLLDTDIGSDIDDSAALAYLLAQEKCDLLGVTTVSGEPVRRAQMVSALLRAATSPSTPARRCPCSRTSSRPTRPRRTAW